MSTSDKPPVAMFDRGQRVRFRRRNWSAWEIGWVEFQFEYDEIITKVITFEGITINIIQAFGDKIESDGR